MYHSITIGDKNTWDDWHLISKTRPFFNPPKLKTKYLEIPGASGSIDVSQILTGYPLYSNREGSIDFTILNTDDLEDSSQMKWYDLYSEMMNYLNRKNFKAVLEDEPDYYYEGQFTVNSYKPGDSASNTRGVITVGYTLGPYKWANQTTTEEWIWDTFSFEHGVVYPAVFEDIRVDGETVTKIFTTREMGYAPARFTLSCTPDEGKTVLIHLDKGKDSYQESITSGEIYTNTGPTDTWVKEITEFIFYDEVELSISGNGKVSIDFRVGRL